MTTPHPTIEHISRVWSRGNSPLITHGEGAWLYDGNGNRYLDFTCGIGVTNTGHAHPKVVAAIQQQAARLIHGQANIVYHQPMLDLIEALLPVVPAGLDRFFFSNSGAEIVEASVKLARWVTGRPNVIAFQGGFHGRTNATMSLTTAKTIYRAGHQPLAAGVFVAPFPYAYRYGWDEATAVEFCLRELRHLLSTQTAPAETAAMLIEPELGEGGYIPVPDAFMRGLREICDEHGILLIADEVQSGFGRTGRWFAMEHSGVTPDILLMAKGIASGMPLSGLAAPAALMDKWPPGSHGGTYGGNVISCAAATATIQAIHEEGMIENAAEMGGVLRAGLNQLREQHPAIGDVRGWGLMVASEFSHPDGNPWPERAKAVTQAAFADNRLLLLTCGTYGNVIRWIPPLNVTGEQMAQALEMFAAALEATA